MPAIDLENAKTTKQGYTIFYDSVKKMHYTQESLTESLRNHTEYMPDYGALGLGTNFMLDGMGIGGPPATGTQADVAITVQRGARFTHGGMSAAYGKLYVNGEYWFDTGERNLLNPGTYKAAFRKETGATMTGRKDWLQKGAAGDPLRRFAVYSKGYVPLILGTPGRAGIRIHQGTSVAWSEGCLITGNYVNGKLENSWECWKRLYDYCYGANSVSITYQG